MAITDKLSYLQETKELLRDVINSKGGMLTESDPFRDYVDAVESIEGGAVIQLPVSEEAEF